MNEPPEKRSGFAGQRLVLLPAQLTASALFRRPLLRPLTVAGAGLFPKAAGHLRRRPEGAEALILIYCLKGAGWCELGGQRHAIRQGDLVVLPPRLPHAYGANISAPWTIHWVHALGDHIPEYLKELGASLKKPVVRVGEDLQILLLFDEILRTIERGCTFPELLRASHTLAHLLALAIRHRHDQASPTGDGLRKVAQSITYMSEHLDESLHVSALAALANLSPSHFTVLFKEQTGCSPRDYLHLLRVHRACQLLDTTSLSLKQIAARLGYQDQFHFSRKFKAFQGVPPSEYRAHPPGLTRQD